LLVEILEACRYPKRLGNDVGGEGQARKLFGDDIRVRWEYQVGKEF